MKVRHLLSWLMMGSACVVAAGPAGSVAKRARATACAQALWQAALRSDRPEPQAGEPAVWLSIPSVRLGLPVLYGVTEERLHELPCAVAWPGRTFGEPGLLVILAHRDAHFRPLENLRKGASVSVTRRDGTKRVLHVTAIDILDAESAEQKIRRHRGNGGILLITCHPFRCVGPAPKRILFWAS